MGYINPEQTPDYLALADVIVLPRKPHKVCELVAPIKLVEAMAMGKPVVASNLPALSEMIKHGESGLLFPAGDTKALAKYLESLAKNPKLQSQLGNVAYRHVISNFLGQYLQIE